MILDRFRLTDRAAIVTGAGRGIGAATAIALAEAGADVVIAARTEEQLLEVAKKIEAAGRTAVVVPADLNDLDVMAQLVDKATDAFGRLDIIVNNHGGWMPRPLLDVSPGHLERAFRYNVSSAHALVRAAVPAMMRGDGGAVVNISSMAGRVAPRGLHRLRHGQGGAVALHAPGRRRAGAAHPGQRHRGGHHRHLGGRHRGAGRGHAGLHRGDGPGGAHRATRGHRGVCRLPGVAGRRLRHGQDLRDRRRRRAPPGRPGLTPSVP